MSLEILRHRFLLSANFLSFTRALAMCERTVAFEQSSRARHFLGRQIFHIAQHQRGPLPRRQPFESRRQPVALFGRAAAQLQAFPHGSRAASVDLAESHPAVTAQKIERRVGGDPREPVGGFQVVFELVLPLQGFDESFLSQILRVVNVADHPVNLAENAPQILVDEAVLQFSSMPASRAAGSRSPALGVVLILIEHAAQGRHSSANDSDGE